MNALAKLCGGDIELGSFLVRPVRRAREVFDDEAARAVLAEIAGVPSLRPCIIARGVVPQESLQDRGRKFLASNGGCVYIDLDHLELCLPEVTSAFDHVAAWHAMLRISGDALARANARQPVGHRIHLLANNSDGHGHSYGAHLDFLITRRAFDDLFRRKLQHLLWLASYQVSSIVFTGAGKVGSEDGADASFQISQRADFMETLVGAQTTYARPIVNSRDEPLCGRRYARHDPYGIHDTGDGSQPMARLHVIFFDSTLAHVPSLLRVGVMQIILAMLEAGHIDLSLILEEPLAALGLWSRDLSFRAEARSMQGERIGALALQTRFLEQAARFVAAGGCESIVPRADEILLLWADSLETLRAGSLDRMAERFDWALKLTQLREAMRRHPSLDWRSPEIKHLDHAYSSVDPNDGLYWVAERAGQIRRLVTNSHIERFVHEPPDDTRAFTRAHLLRRLGATNVDEVDWDYIRCWLPDGAGRSRSLNLQDPLGMTRALAEPAFLEAVRELELFDALSQACERSSNDNTLIQGGRHERATTA